MGDCWDDMSKWIIFFPATFILSDFIHIYFHICIYITSEYSLWGRYDCLINKNYSVPGFIKFNILFISLLLNSILVRLSELIIIVINTWTYKQIFIFEKSYLSNT